MKSVLLIGLGHFGQILAKQLVKLGHEVLAVDREEERVNEVLPFVTNAQIGDCTSPEFLRELGAESFDICFVAISGDFQSSLEATSLLKEQGAKTVVARAETDIQEKFLLRNGADAVVYPEKQASRWAATRYTVDHILDFVELDETHGIFEIPVPDGWAGKNVGALAIRQRYNLNILAIRRGDALDLSITPETTLTSEQTLLVLGDRKDVDRCLRA